MILLVFFFKFMVLLYRVHMAVNNRTYMKREIIREQR